MNESINNLATVLVEVMLCCRYLLFFHSVTFNMVFFVLCGVEMMQKTRVSFGGRRKMTSVPKINPTPKKGGVERLTHSRSNWNCTEKEERTLNFLSCLNFTLAMTRYIKTSIGPLCKSYVKTLPFFPSSGSIPHEIVSGVYCSKETNNK